MISKPFSPASAIGFALSLIFLSGSFSQIHASGLTPIERATHIVHGKVESSDCRFAGGVIAMTEINIKVWEVIKNSDNLLAAGNRIKVLVHGCFEGEIQYSNAENKTILFSDGAEVILPLAKYYDHYKLFDEAEPFSIAHVHKNQVSTHDSQVLEDTDAPGAKSRFIARQNRIWRDLQAEKEERISNALNEDLFLRERVGAFGGERIKSLDSYLGMMEEKSNLAGMNGARKAPLVVMVRVVSASQSGAKDEHVSEIRFEWLKDIKGKINAKTFALALPDQATAKACGFLLPQAGQKGLLLLQSKDKLLPIPQYFIPLDDDEAMKVGKGKMTGNEWKRNLSAER